MSNDKDKETAKESQEEKTSTAKSSVPDLEAELEETKKSLQSAIEQKKHFREKYEKVRTAVSEDEGEDAEEESGEKAKTESTRNFPQDPVEQAVLLKKLSEYSPDEIRVAERHARAEEVSLSEALDNEDVQLLIKAKREKAEREGKTPSGTSRTTSGKAQKDFSELSEEERKAEFDDRVREAISKGRSGGMGRQSGI